MNNERALKILLEPHVSEKAAQAAIGSFPLYAFKAVKDANKIDIRAAVEYLFNVKVRSVRILNVKSKATRFRQTKGRHKGWKKVYVALEKGQEIDLEAI